MQMFYGVLPNYGSKSLHSYCLSFVYEQDPNAKAGDYMHWPQWGNNQSLMNSSIDRGALMPDDFHQDSYEQIMAILPRSIWEYKGAQGNILGASRIMFILS